MNDYDPFNEDNVKKLEKFFNENRMIRGPILENILEHIAFGNEKEGHSYKDLYNDVHMAPSKNVDESECDQTQLSQFYNSFSIASDEVQILERTNMPDQRMFLSPYGIQDPSKNPHIVRGCNCKTFGPSDKITYEDWYEKLKEEAAHLKKRRPMKTKETNEESKSVLRKKDFLAQDSSSDEDSPLSDNDVCGNGEKNNESTNQKNEKLSKEETKKRNKEKSKRCRDKKKMHYQYLERRVQRLENENDILKAEVEIMRRRCEGMDKNDINTLYNQVNEGLTKRLQDLYSKKNNSGEINSTVQLFKSKIRELDLQKKLELKSTFTKMIDDSLPNCTKAILWACLERRSIFQVENQRSEHSQKVERDAQEDGSPQNKDTSEIRELTELLKLSKDQKEKIREGGVVIRSEAIKLKELVEALFRMKREMFHQITRLQLASQNCKLFMTTKQFGKYLVWLNERTHMHLDTPTVSEILKLNQHNEGAHSDEEIVPILAQVDHIHFKYSKDTQEGRK